MSYLEGLLYNPKGSKMEETRQGVPIFHRTPQDLPEWKFKVELETSHNSQVKCDENDPPYKLDFHSPRGGECQQIYIMENIYDYHTRNWLNIENELRWHPLTPAKHRGRLHNQTINNVSFGG